MRNILAPIALSACAMGFVASANGQEPSSGDNLEQAAQDFLTMKRAEQNRIQGRLSSNGRGAEIGQLRALVAASGFARPSAGKRLSAGTAQAVEQSLITDAAHYLASANFTPARVAAYRKASVNPIESAINLVRGTATAYDAAILADRVVVGTVTGVEDLTADTSIVTLVISDTVLGESGQSVRFEQGGSLSAPLQSTLLPDDPARVLVFLTDPAGNMRGRGGADSLPTTLVSPFSEAGSVFRPRGLSTLPPVSLSDLKQRVAPLTSLRGANQ